MAEWIKPGTNFDFIGRSRLFVGISVAAVLLTFATFGFRKVTQGTILNYGTDFSGGSEVQIQLARAEDPGRIRHALEEGGYRGAEVVRLEVPGQPNMFLLRLGQVSPFSQEQADRARANLEGKLGKDQVRRFDFSEGGDKIHVRLAQDAEPATIEEAFKAAGITPQKLERFGRTQDNQFQVTLVGLDAELRKLFDAKLGAGAVQDIPQVESVGAKVGAQLRNDGFLSVLWTLLLILLYVALRFNFEFAPAGVAALLHDVLLTAGVFSLLWRDFTLQTVAALLTIGGYSINDTIVLFDRVRENLGRLRDRKLPVLVNTSINETLGRTLLTSLATIFTSLSVWYFTRGPVRDFGMALTVGFFFGVYSTIFVASPVYLYLHDWGAARRVRRVNQPALSRS